MKKITLLMILVLSGLGVQAQTDYYTVLPNNGGTSQNGRAPQGARPAGRSVWLITAAEMAAAGFDTGSVVNSLGFRYSVAQNTTTTGTIVIYLQNTTDATNTKSTAWATAITGMTTVSNSAVTLPNTAGTFDIPFTGGSPFTYTGDGLYVAFDYQNFANPVATVPNTVLCNNSLAAGLLGAMTAAGGTTPPATVAASAFRPETRLGKAVACARPTNLDASNSTLNSADLSFDVTAGGTVDLEYDVQGFTQGTGTVVNNITSPYTLGGLSSSTVYDYYVRKSCNVTDQSSWNGPLTFSTLFTSVDPTYTESFENLILPFVGWTAIPETTSDGWFINAGLAQDGDFTTASITPAAAAADARMYSRGVNLIAGSDVTVTYYVQNYVATSTNTASYELTVGTAMDVASQTTVVGSETGLSNATYVQKTFTFTAPSTGVFYFAFHHTSPANAAGTHALLIDNFVVTQTLGTNEYLSGKFNVYPNPAANVINIANTVDATINTIEMSDLNGRVVKSVKMNAAEGQVSVSDLATGVYMMKISTDQGVAIKKIVKE
jgi:hypothetical protein